MDASQGIELLMEIKLTNGEYSLIDKEDIDLISNFKWHKSTSGYAIAYKGLKMFYMHREILRLGSKKETGFETDHMNFNKLDNRKQNLRIATISQNRAHKIVRSDSKSGFKGVYKMDKRYKVKTWRSRIKINGRYRILGFFEDKKQAAIAYNEAAKKIQGEFAVLNII